MPHVLISGPCDLRRFWESFAPTLIRNERLIVKAVDVYVASGGKRALVECAVIEGFLRQSFLIELAEREGGMVVRLFGSQKPEKTDGVRYALGWIAHILVQRMPGCRMIAANLGIDLPEIWTDSAAESPEDHLP
ncbi:MAG: hypothetical protein FJY88_10645 [Candidatus Eisenbacteria bacterium]|nr:hypothetical protein [Candidatus Eisenbacteria bacterium]